MKRSRRIIILSDLHCGARTGLTPPQWQSAAPSEHGRSKWAEIQGTCWDWYTNEIGKLGEVDLVICNGDAIDGCNERAGGTELITSDRHKQCEIAAECLSQIPLRRGGKRYLVRGTPYHTGKGEDFEDVLADTIDAAIGNHTFLKVHQTTFDLKHKVGSSTIPHGRHTAISRERLWNQIWADHHGAPKADVLVRSHVHYFTYCGGAGWLAVVTPALQSFGSKFGARECSGTVDYGFLTFDVAADGSYSWRPHLAQIRVMMPQTTVVF